MRRFYLDPPDDFCSIKNRCLYLAFLLTILDESFMKNLMLILSSVNHKMEENACGDMHHAYI